MIELLIKILISILPVIIFLIALIFLDSYKLVRFRFVLAAIAMGFVAAVACLIINNDLQGLMKLDATQYSRYIAPIVEELLKAAFMVYVIRSRRVGFLVDAAILGFALGTGFAIFENMYKLSSLAESGMFLWIVRGFGTAVMHGGATAVFAVISKSLSERRGSESMWVYLPGFMFVAVIHSTYNHFFLAPALSAAALVIGLPLIMIIVYQQSEKATQRWLGVGFDTDKDLLGMITTGDIEQTHLGQYLLSLKERFSGEVVVDMLCLLRIHLELSIRAKAILLLRENGFDVPRDLTVRAKFDELRYLETSIGRTGRFAIMPVLRWNSRDLWQLHMLEGE
ncbi:MAG: PrsW family glutamic-type intramembrane protease [Candidatus Latescibacterota bacterium]